MCRSVLPQKRQHVRVGLLNRWNPFRRTFIAVTPGDQRVVGRATLNEGADLTLFEHEGQVELLWIDMAVEDAESFPFGPWTRPRRSLLIASASAGRTGPSRP